LIEVDNLQKFYGRKPRLTGVSFSVARGELVGCLGLNGAGKSTALRILSGLSVPTAGRAAIDGLDVVHESRDVRARIGYLPDIPPLYDEMSVHSYLLFAAQIRGLGRRQAVENVIRVEEQTGLAEVRSERTAHLSHGFKQRVGIAQALVHRPAVLILDEPTGGLDPAQVVEMRGLIRSL